MVRARKSFLKEFHNYVVTVVHRREAGANLREIADDFRISEACMQSWLREN